MFQEDLGILIGGDCKRSIVQYSLNLSTNIGKVQKKYGEIGIAHVASSAYIGNLAIFGGGNSLLRFIDMKNRILIGNIFKTSINSIKFMQVCPVINPQNKDDWKVFLCVSGSNASISSTDVIDITQLVKKMEIPLSVIEKGHLTS